MMKNVILKHYKIYDIQKNNFHHWYVRNVVYIPILGKSTTVVRHSGRSSYYLRILCDR